MVGVNRLQKPVGKASWKRLISLLVLCVGFLSACSTDKPQLQTGEAMPELTLPGLDGQPLTFPTGLEGKVVAIRFWADWCPFCESEMRDIEPVYLKYRDRGLAVLAVNVRQDQATARAFIDKLDVSYRVLLDEDGAVARRYGVIGLPTTFFVDRQGRLSTRILGESTPEAFENIVQGLL